MFCSSSTDGGVGSGVWGHGGVESVGEEEMAVVVDGRNGRRRRSGDGFAKICFAKWKGS